MKAEIIAVGTELLMGEVVNSNATWLSAQLAELGIDVYHHTTVGDNPRRINAVVDGALHRFANLPLLPDGQPLTGILLFSGGLGPTPDDLTVQTLADHFQSSMIQDTESEAVIRGMFIARGQPMAASNIKQALRPPDAQVLANPLGTAPGIIWEVSGKTTQSGVTAGPTLIMTFPGVPSELKAMWPQAKQVLMDRLHSDGETPQVLVSRTLHFFGIGESMLASKLDDLMRQDSEVTVAPYVGRAQVRIRLAAKAASEPHAKQLLDPVHEEITRRVGEFLIGDDAMSPEQYLPFKVGERLKAGQKWVSIAESCTGGLISSRLTDIPGSSAYLGLNLVTYSNTFKTQLLEVAPQLILNHGAVSEEVAAAMARGVQRVSGAQVGVGITGIAGPDGGTEDKPVGTAYVAFSGLTPEPIVHKIGVSPKNPRPEIKFWFSQYALFYLLQYLGQVDSL